MARLKSDNVQINTGVWDGPRSLHEMMRVQDPKIKMETLFMPRKRKLIYFSLDLDEFEPYYDM